MDVKLALTVDPKLMDEVLKPYMAKHIDGVSQDAEMEAMTFGLHESEEFGTMIKAGIVLMEGKPMDTVIPTAVTHGFFMGLKYAAARDAKKISGEEEYREPEPPVLCVGVMTDPMAEMITGHGRGCVCLECVRKYTDRAIVPAAAPPKPHIRRVGKILGGEKSTGGKTQ